MRENLLKCFIILMSEPASSITEYNFKPKCTTTLQLLQSKQKSEQLTAVREWECSAASVVYSTAVCQHIVHNQPVSELNQSTEENCVRLLLTRLEKYSSFKSSETSHALAVALQREMDSKYTFLAIREVYSSIPCLVLAGNSNALKLAEHYIMQLIRQHSFLAMKKLKPKRGKIPISKGQKTSKNPRKVDLLLNEHLDLEPEVNLGVTFAKETDPNLFKNPPVIF
ncbi:hypothetical protein MG293_014552 [Ovis ammon polii]|uniref:Uncharacterized protein n=1 Tax=Ovis ammon polii TaxID=230172 RepID=A0AAD4TXT2_OVIAM|nr:hypothetical protein MG293_014552 [Ovis ammon polii]